MNNNYVFVDADTWCGLYLNEILIAQDHSLKIRDIFDIIIKNGGTITSYQNKRVDYDWMDERGDLPISLKEVVFEK